MKRFEHVTKGTLATMIEPNVLVIDGSNERLDISDITLRRWWKEIEETPAAEDEPMKMSETITALETLFDKLNGIYFDGELPKPVITVQSTPKVYGHCSTKRVWKSDDTAMYEINLGAEFINRPMPDTAATLCHEMVHLYCLENEIQDTCQNGRYHNKTFKAEAEARDLNIEYNRAIGYSITSPTDALIEKLTASGFNMNIRFARVAPAKKTCTDREKPHKYICPICGQAVRSTSELKIKCAICDVDMERAD